MNLRPYQNELVEQVRGAWREGFKAPCIVLGCGGGLRSETLCQMLADLSGLELRLLPGFDQATLYGLTILCDCACGTGMPNADREPVHRYFPRRNALIHRYHERWREERLSLNPPVSNN